MTNEERDTDLPPEATPETRGGPSPLEETPGSSERPEQHIGEHLGDTADSVTRELRDLQDELLPPSEPPASEASWSAGASTVDQPSEMPGELPAGDTTSAVLPANPPERNSQAFGETPATVEGTNDDRLLSMLAWLSMVIFQLPVVSIIQLLSENTKNQPFQRHHAITSLLFWVAAIAYEIVATLVFTLITLVTLGCGAFCLWVIFFVPHALALYYAFQAYSGKRVELPYLSTFARRQGWL